MKILYGNELLSLNQQIKQVSVSSSPQLTNPTFSWKIKGKELQEIIGIFQIHRNVDMNDITVRL